MDGITLISLNDRQAWQQATTDALPGHSWGHAAGLAADGLVPELAVVQSQGARMILPFHQRAFGPHVDIATLPGLSGAWVQGDSAAPLAAWSDYAKLRGWVTGYVQLSPRNDALGAIPPDRIRSHNALFVFDLSRWDIATSVGPNTRHTLRSGTRLGATLVTDPARLSRHFADLHAQTRARSGQDMAFGAAALATWFDTPGVTAFGADLNGQVVAAQLGRRQGTWADLHLAGASDAGRGLQGWLIWQALEWLRGQGVTWVNIGGYGQPGDGLHQMKQRLGAAEHPLRAVLQVYDPAAFSDLCRQVGADPDADYFPAYRSIGPLERAAAP